MPDPLHRIDHDPARMGEEEPLTEENLTHDTALTAPDEELEDDFETSEDAEADGIRGLGAQFGPLGEDGTCAACAHAKTTAWWGDIRPARSHCRTCHRFWASLREAHCTRCHRHFAYTRAFDEHFRNNTCGDPATLLRQDGQARFTAREGRFGVTYKLAYYGEPPAHWVK